MWWLKQRASVRPTQSQGIVLSNPLKGSSKSRLVVPSGLVLFALTFLAVNGLLRPGGEQFSGRYSLSESTPLKLRYDWTNLSPSTELGKRMAAHQMNCSLPMGTSRFRDIMGLGSDLHVWGQAVCNGMESGLRVRTVGEWNWMDKTNCKGVKSPLHCYFKAVELNCPQDEQIAKDHPEFDEKHALSLPTGRVPHACPHVYKETEMGNLRMASTDYMFTRLTPLVVEEAERQLNLVFQGLSEVPKDLISVHIRWGDKGADFKLLPAEKYVDAVKMILQKRTKAGPVNVYLATEDPDAVKQFLAAVPSSWNIYVDQFFTDMLPHHQVGFNSVPKMAQALEGAAGLVALGSVLVAMEAKDYVLTTGSNWSRLMNELRKAILDPRCNKCTSMIDLRPPVVREW